MRLKPGGRRAYRHHRNAILRCGFRVFRRFKIAVERARALIYVGVVIKRVGLYPSGLDKEWTNRLITH
jgi:hypothetical protein